MTTPIIPDDVLDACLSVLIFTPKEDLRKVLLEYDKRMCEPLRLEITMLNQSINLIEQSRNSLWGERDVALARVKELENKIENIGEFRLHRHSEKRWSLEREGEGMEFSEDILLQHLREIFKEF